MARQDRLDPALDSRQPSSNIGCEAASIPTPVLWPAAAPDQKRELSSQTGDVHVWAARLSLPSFVLAQVAATLSRGENERADRFRFKQHRNRFIAGRGLLRTLLAGYLDTEAHQIELGYGAWGKPRLGGRFAGDTLQFNVAHSEDLALFAFTRGGLVGIDLERIRPLSDMDELVARFFSKREHIAFVQLSPELRSVAFFNLWTRKEAWLKATGEGIAHSLHLVEVSFLPGEPPALLSLPEFGERVSAWSMCELKPANGFAAALAFGGVNRAAVQCWKWEQRREALVTE